MPSRSPSLRTNSASRAESARSPWSTWSTWSRRPHAGASVASTWRRATESAPPDTATKTVSPPASIAWRRIVRSTRSSRVTTLPALESHPDLAVLEVLLLPDGHRALERVDRVLARLEGLVTMGRRHGDEDARLADLEPAGAAAHRRGEAELVVGAQPVLGGDVLVADREQRERTVSRELGMAFGHGRPRRLNRPALG